MECGHGCLYFRILQTGTRKIIYINQERIESGHPLSW